MDTEKSHVVPTFKVFLVLKSKKDSKTSKQGSNTRQNVTNRDVNRMLGVFKEERNHICSGSLVYPTSGEH